MANSIKKRRPGWRWPKEGLQILGVSSIETSVVEEIDQIAAAEDSTRARILRRWILEGLATERKKRAKGGGGNRTRE